MRYDNIFDNLICQTTYSTLLKNLSPSCSYIPIATSTHLHLNGPFPAFFLSIFVFSLQLTVNVQYRFLPMTGFEPRTSIIGSNRSNNWATPLPLCTCFIIPTPTLMAFTGVTNAHGPSLAHFSKNIRQLVNSVKVGCWFWSLCSWVECNLRISALRESRVLQFGLDQNASS